MAKYWIRYIGIALLALCGVSCAEEDWMGERGTLDDKEVWVTLSFGHQDFEPIEISTRSTLDEVAESRVSDIYALIFINDKCVYNKYFGADDATKKTTQAEVVNATEECWWVQNRTSTTNTSGYTDDDTHGTIRLRTPSMTGGELYLIVNANAHTVNISPEKLGTIRTKQDLNNLTAQLNGEVLTRYGYFPMVAALQGVNISENGITQTINGSTTTNVVAELVRLDAKIDVNVMAATGATSLYGNGDAQISVSVREFTPLSWQVMNVPKGAYIIEQDSQSEDMTYFNSAATSFEISQEVTYESKATIQHSFSFYMLENQQFAQGNITNYHQRDLRKKSNSGAYLHPLPETGDDEKDIWQYAPENSTYLILKGYLSMNSPSTNEGVQEVGADVTYYIHLGDFGSSVSSTSSSLNNFSIERNTHYTYNIVVKGLRNIELEVTENRENQSGATGNIYATENIVKQLDAHYEQFTTFIDVNSLDADAMSWYVDTPFGLKGSPKLNEGIDQGMAGYEQELQNYDYKWMWFMVNPLSTNGNSYIMTNQWYPGDQYRTGGSSNKALGDTGHLMNVDEFVEYLRQQKRNYSSGATHVFKQNGANMGIAVTVFVDEYYYEQHPITGEAQNELWKKFVNQPSRLLHVLSANHKSADGESSITSGLITVKQKSIQTPYNVGKSSLSTAWGCETIDEFKDSHLWLYSPTETNNKNEGLPSGLSAFTGNTSSENGRYNTAVMWGLLSNGTWNSSATENWKNFIDYERVNDYKPTTGTYGNIYTGFLKSGKETHLSAILQRNRDNNGNKKIDADEVRWYMASINQLYGIYIGGLGLNTEAQLYTKEIANSTGLITQGPYVSVGTGGVAAEVWRHHIISSTKRNTHPTILWAEQGLSISDYRQDVGWGEMGIYQVRCIRNLGQDYANESVALSAIVQESAHPQALITYQVKDANGNVISETSATSSSIYEFDLSNVNASSLRATATEMELWPSNEFDYNARTYTGFRTAPSTVTIASGSGKILNDYYTPLKNYLMGTTSTSNYAGKELEGYRVPNIREAAIMGVFCKNTSWWNSGQTLVNTYSYRNQIGKDDKLLTWAFCQNYASMAAHHSYSLYVRPVQDFNPE